MLNKLVLASLIVAGSTLTFAHPEHNGTNLSDLEKMTFQCPAAALNAAAREAAKAKTDGSYQFIGFQSAGDNRLYYVTFESNVEGEPKLNYEVTLYCQQGWDPNKTVQVVLKK